MAEVIEETIKNVVENITEPAITGKKIPSTPEGMAVAYGSLVIMALLPIYFGAKRSLKYHKEQKNTSKNRKKMGTDETQTTGIGEKPDYMTSTDAMMFPIIASGALIGLYLVFTVFSKDYVNMLLSGYFFILGILALSHLLSPVLDSLMPASIPKIPYHIKFTKGRGASMSAIIDYKFSTYDIICLQFSILIGVWYLYDKHWIANNMFGLAFCVNAVELLYLNNVVTGCILLCGLFFYDIFWVFGTNVMVTVAKSFDAPIKLVFPQDILVNGFNASNFAMLGLGDIVIPGIFIALLLRFDSSLKRKGKTYFYVTFFAYFMGLMATILVMHVFKHAQPALLYLVPACLGTPLLLALIKGDIKRLFAYEDHPEQTAEKEKSDKNEKDDKSNNKETSSKKKEAKKAK